MLELKKGVDILAEVGGIQNIADARAFLEQTLDPTSQTKLSRIENEEALIKIANAISICEPEAVFVVTGSEEDAQWVRNYSLRKGEEHALAKAQHTYHFDLPQEQARLVDQTFYVVNPDEKYNTMAKAMLRSDALTYVRDHMKGIMAGRTLMIGFFIRGPRGAVAATPAIEISSSSYVFHSAGLLYRSCYEDFDAEAARRGFFFTNLHSEGLNRPEDVPNARILMDRSWQTTFSAYCTYAGNTLLMKKGNHRFSVDYATYYQSGRELSEHMFITGVTGPGGRKTYIVGAAPSGCGKTTTAMVGSHFVGDDLAQMWIADDGTVRACNPEQGIFGIVRDVNEEGDPNLMKCLRGDGVEVIYSNILVTNGVPYWEGCGEEIPDKGINFQGMWHKGKVDASGKPIPPSHKNARCTLKCETIANHDIAANADPDGVEVKVVTYSGRDADTMPPVWVARSMNAGVAIGASIVSRATATEIGATGVRRQPWANAPFIPGDLTDYMRSQFAFFNNDNVANKPLMAGLNYFLTHKNRGSDKPGLLGEKRDVRVWLGWLERFAHGDVTGIETPIGVIPKYDDLNTLFAAIGKDYPEALYAMQFAFYVDNIIKRIDLQTSAYGQLSNLPPQLFAVYQEQKAGLLTLREKYGPVVSVQQLIEG
ncbi:MAG: phosphoenolpyruvate carboxykinase (GTP) [Myxococcota bacterium]